MLFKYLKIIDESSIELCGEKFTRKDFEIVTLTTGKLSVEEISSRLNLNISAVIKILNKLENKHLIVYTLH